MTNKGMNTGMMMMATRVMSAETKMMVVTRRIGQNMRMMTGMVMVVAWANVPGKMIIPEMDIDPSSNFPTLLTHIDELHYLML